jgi:hypothetical protein
VLLFLLHEQLDATDVGAVSRRCCQPREPLAITRLSELKPDKRASDRVAPRQLLERRSGRRVQLLSAPAIEVRQPAGVGRGVGRRRHLRQP